jgi:hypothetical protein
MLNKPSPRPKRTMSSVGIAPNIAIFIVTTRNIHQITQFYTALYFIVLD